MRVEDTFMAFIVVEWDVEKYYLKLLRVLGLCEGTWVWVLSMLIMCDCFVIDFFKDMYEYVIGIVNLCWLCISSKCDLA